MNNERLEVIFAWGFGFTLAIIYGFVAKGIGVNDVSKEKSFGLDIILASLQTLGVGWVAYMMARLQRGKEPPK